MSEQQREANVEGVNIRPTPSKDYRLGYDESDVAVVLRRGAWNSWDDAIRWLQQNGERDNELTPGEAIAITEDFRKLKSSGVPFTRDARQVWQVMTGRK